MIEKLKEMIEKSNNIVFFGGAGVSTESGIPDFRSKDGLYSQKYDYPPEIIVSRSFFLHYPEEFYKFYRDKLIYHDILPNDAHKALAKLEKAGKLKAVITQNIDGLHQLAGSKNVIELHGSIQRNYCLGCGEAYKGTDIIEKCNGVPRCKKCGAIIRPDVVLYEEQLNSESLKSAIHYVSTADLLIVGGTSLAVEPAASLVHYYFTGSNLVIINKTDTDYDYKASLVIHDSIGKVLSQVV